MAEGDFLYAVADHIPLMTLGPTAKWSFSHSSPGESQDAQEEPLSHIEQSKLQF